MIDYLTPQAPLPETPVNVATVPQYSPFRYPGGKTWLIPWVRRWLASGPRKSCIVEPFAGGGAITLMAVLEGLAKSGILVELDEDVAAVWRTVFSTRVTHLVNAVTKFECTLSAVNELLASRPQTTEDRAFRTIVMNRTRYGGIIAPGSASVKLGENGRGVSSRWYPSTLKKRILFTSRQSRRFAFVQGDGLEFLERASRYPQAVFFIDPPYTVTGQRLYAHSEIDHERLFHIVSRLNGDFLMTYDDSEEIKDMAQRRGFESTTVPMHSTKHETKRELLIGKNLHWMADKLNTGHLLKNSLFEGCQVNGHTSGQPLY